MKVRGNAALGPAGRLALVQWHAILGFADADKVNAVSGEPG